MINTPSGWIIERLEIPPLYVNTYVVGRKGGGTGLVIDPGNDLKRITNCVQAHNLSLTGIVNTHGHWDHIAGNAGLRKATFAPILIGAGDADYLTDPYLNCSAMLGGALRSPHADRLLREGDVIIVGNAMLTVLEMPGHSHGGIALAAPGLVFAGDSLFAGSIGRTDFPGGDLELLQRMIREKLFTMDDSTVVYPGHGPETTIGDERRGNPFLKEEG